MPNLTLIREWVAMGAQLVNIRFLVVFALYGRQYILIKPKFDVDMYTMHTNFRVGYSCHLTISSSLCL